MDKLKKPNEKLRLQRELQGWSQARLAEKIGTTVKRVSMWECGDTAPDCYYQEALITLFGKNAQELGFLNEAIISSPNKSELTPSPPQPSPTFEKVVVEQNQDIEGYDDMKRRKAMQAIGGIVGATSVFLMTPQTLLNSDDLERLTRTLAKPSRVDVETINGLQRTVENYWRLRIHGSIGSPDLLDAAIGHFRVIIALLQQSHIPTTRTYLCAVASETSQLVGRLLVDMRDHDTALSYYKDSLIAAQQSNNDALYAAGLGRMATVFATLGKPQDALSLLETAQQTVANTNAFTLCAWLAAETAETQAEIGNQEASKRILEQALHFANQIQSDEYTYGENFSASRVPAYQGTCHMRLCQPQLALPALHEGLNAPEVSDGLKQSVLLDITEASIQAKEVEQACSYMHHALDIIARLDAVRFVQRAYKLRQQMEPWAKVQLVKDVDERLALFKGVA
jgi:transcriptional regulator with XRE-family HTH domain